ncbi:MAG: GNAT family N-acetyltransferase [Bacteroidia bacterium]|nr:GNAT family N-acetyltransferase [Bacteroidia bacterium]
MKEEVLIREYREDDKAAVLQLFRLNTPASFSVLEEKDLLHYLEREREAYFVLERNRELLGCGGYHLSGDQTCGTICWDIFHPSFQRQGLGSRLLDYRLSRLKACSGLHTITVRTSQMAYRFYGKHGFVLRETVEDYWAKGFHLYRMEINL